MTKYRNSSQDSTGLLAGILALALLVVIFARFFIPLLIVWLVYLAYYFCNRVYMRSNVMLVVLSVLTGISGVCFMLRLEENAEPEISLSFATAWSDKYEVEPLLEESITQGEDGNFYITLTDHCISYEYSCDNTPDIKVEVKAKGDATKKVKAELSVTQVGMKMTSDMPFWMQNNSRYFEDKVLYSGDGLSYTIDGDNLRFNESGYDAEQPTEIIIEAKNKEGSDRITLIVTKIPVYMACEQYKGVVGDVKLCRERQAYVDKEKAEKEAKEKAETEWKNKVNSNSSSGASTGTGTSRTCAHYEAGRCWDDLEMEAYDQGRYDKTYGYYGQGYYEGGDCDSVCQSILEDAYDEGYYDGY